MGRRSCCAKEGVKRGAWTSKEDDILAAFITAHGQGKWRELPQKAGLRRCGKSCRLRWLNYLRPNIKHGNISDDEVELIARLHKLLGNRWSLIAARLPGRTDNEIKNYWNSRLGRRAAGAGAGGTPASPATPAASGSCESNQQKGAAPRGDPDSAGSAAGAGTTAMWAPKAVRGTGGLFLHRDAPAAGETGTTGGAGGSSGEGSDDCSSAAESAFAGADKPCFSGSASGGNWMDDVRAVASFLESDEEWVRGVR